MWADGWHIVSTEDTGDGVIFARLSTFPDLRAVADLAIPEGHRLSAAGRDASVVVVNERGPERLRPYAFGASSSGSPMPVSGSLFRSVWTAPGSGAALVRRDGAGFVRRFHDGAVVESFPLGVSTGWAIDIGAFGVVTMRVVEPHDSRRITFSMHGETTWERTLEVPSDGGAGGAITAAVDGSVHALVHDRSLEPSTRVYWWRVPSAGEPIVEHVPSPGAPFSGGHAAAPCATHVVMVQARRAEGTADSNPLDRPVQLRALVAEDPRAIGAIELWQSDAGLTMPYVSVMCRGREAVISLRSAEGAQLFRIAW